MADWEQVKTAYLSGELSVASLCLKFEISKNHLYRKVNEEAWPKRRAKTKSKAKAKTTQQNVWKQTPGRHETLLDQMMSMIEKHLEKLDRQLGDEERDSSADARQLTALAQAYRQLDSLKRQDTEGDKKHCKDHELKQGDDDAEAFRARLEARLAKFGKPAKK